MKEQITNSRLKEKLRVGLGLIKQANEMIDKLNADLKDKEAEILELKLLLKVQAIELKKLKTNWIYKLFQWIKT